MIALGQWMTGAALAALALPTQAQQAVPYMGIPPGFDFPAEKQRLEAMRKNEDLRGLRLHAWMVFAGMTQTTADGTPAWETWYPPSETFRPAGPLPQGPRRVVPQFNSPRQLQGARGRVQPQAPGASLLSRVLFNKETHDHIRSKRLFEARTLNRLNSGFPPDAPWNERKVPDFPAPAVSLKTIWWPVKKDGVTALPVWDGRLPNRVDQGNPFQAWPRVVAVDPTRRQVPDNETTTIDFAGRKFQSARVVGLDRFYVVPVTADIVRSFNSPDTNPTVRRAVQLALGRPIQVGDHIVFLGTHITTKEIDDWTWATLWWHDRPDDGPYAADRPPHVTGVWRNYLMTIADDQVTPKESDGSPRIAFNPWLESFPNGSVSNCMTCHNRASWPDPDFMPVTRGLPDVAGDRAFRRGQLRTDFMWSIPSESQ